MGWTGRAYRRAPPASECGGAGVKADAKEVLLACQWVRHSSNELLAGLGVGSLPL